MTRSHIDHNEIAKFAKERVNLPKTKADEYRAQAKRLRDKLAAHVADHPDFSLKKMLISGSLAKGTGLRSLNDIDVGCYVSGLTAPTDVPELIDYITEKLRDAFPNFAPEQVKPQTYSISVSFKGTGLDVDIVPILYFDDPQWYGQLVSQDDGSFLETSIPLHLVFIDKRKKLHPSDFTQVIRLTKFWAQKQKREQTGFRLKSFMIEMIFSHLSDEGLSFSDYPEAMQAFFTYIAATELRKPIIFGDYYDADSVDIPATRIKIVDPVNKENNVAGLYTDQQATLIVDAALDAGDAIDAALAAPNKEETLRYWQKLFGTTFSI